MDSKVITNAVTRTLNRIENSFNDFYNYGSDSWCFRVATITDNGFIVEIGTKDDEWFEKFYDYSSFDISQMIIEIMQMLYGIKEDLYPIGWKVII